MYNASKRLQAVRRQLLHMNEQYRNGLDIDEDNSMVETENCQDEPKDLVEKVILCYNVYSCSANFFFNLLVANKFLTLR